MNPSYPILEHDTVSESKLEPSRLIKPRDVPEHCVISFFREVNENIVAEKQARVAVANRWEDGEYPIYEIEHRGNRLAFFHPGVGTPIAAGLFEEAIAFGCKKFVVVGGAGVLVKENYRWQTPLGRERRTRRWVVISLRGARA